MLSVFNSVCSPKSLSNLASSIALVHSLFLKWKHGTVWLLLWEPLYLGCSAPEFRMSSLFWMITFKQPTKQLAKATVHEQIWTCCLTLYSSHAKIVFVIFFLTDSRKIPGRITFWDTWNLNFSIHKYNFIGIQLYVFSLIFLILRYALAWIIDKQHKSVSYSSGGWKGLKVNASRMVTHYDS